MRAILTWHSIDGSGSPISVSREEFARQLAWLAASGVRVTGVPELLASPADEEAVALTFDDGFVSFAAEAMPLLRDRGWPATLFVVSGRVGRDNRWQGRSSPGIPVLPLLDWDVLAGLREAGVRIAAHTRTHPRLDQVNEGQLATELAGCADDLEQKLGIRPDGLAYPYGALAPRVVAAAAVTYSWACTTDLRVLGAAEDPHRLPRIDAWYLRAPERFGPWGSSRLRGWFWLRQGGRRLKSALRATARP